MPVKVLHLNCHLFYGTYVAAFYNKLVYDDARRCRDICNYLLDVSTAADVVVLSEVWSPLMRSMFVERLGGRFPFHWSPPKTSGCLTVGPEFIVFSTEMYQMTCEKHYEVLQNLSGWDKWSEKDIAAVRIGTTLMCFSHYDSSDTPCKYKNVDQTVSFVTRHNMYSGALPAMMMGDLNTQELDQVGQPALSSEYLNLRERFGSVGLVDAHRLIYPNPLDFPFVTQDKDLNQVYRHFDPQGAGKARLDYIFTRNLQVFDAGVDVKNELSDHYPVWVVVDSL